MNGNTSTFDLETIQSAKAFPSFFDCQWTPASKIMLKELYKTIICRLMFATPPYRRDDFKMVTELARTKGAVGETFRKINGQKSSRFYRTDLKTGEKVQNEHPISRNDVYGLLIEIISDAFLAKRPLERLTLQELHDRMMRLSPVATMIHIVSNDITIWSRPGVEGHDYQDKTVMLVGTTSPSYNAINDIIKPSNALLDFLRKLYSTNLDTDTTIGELGEMIKTSDEWILWRRSLFVDCDDPIQFCIDLLK